MAHEFVMVIFDTSFRICFLHMRHLTTNLPTLVIGGSLESPQWLVLYYCSKILSPWWGHMNAICHSVYVHRVVVLLAGGRDTVPPYVIVKLFALTGTTF